MEQVTAGEKTYPLTRKYSGTDGKPVYRVQVTVGHTYPEGKQRQHDYTGSGAADIQAKINRSVRYSDEELRLIPHELTVDGMMDEWVRYKELILEKDRIRNLRTLIRKHIHPYLGAVLIRELTADKLKEWRKEYIARFGNRRIKEVCCTLHDAIRLMVRKGYLLNDVFREIPRSTDTLREQPVLDDGQVELILRNRLKNIYWAAFATMLGTGMRIGECLGFSWKQIDWDRKIITVSRQMDIKGRIRGTKNGRSRSFPVPDYVWDVFREVRRWQDEYEKEGNGYRNDEGLVFVSEQGKALSRIKMNQAMAEYMEGTQNPNVRCHALRRTYASIGAEMGEIHAVKHVLDHSDFRTTIRYIYPYQRDETHLVEIMEDHFLGMLRENGIDRPGMSDKCSEKSCIVSRTAV